eukprot:886046_1
MSQNIKYYDILCVNKNTTQQEIKKKYRELARQLHPDKHPEDPQTYHEKFQQLQKAYEVLSDPHKKQLYDRYGEAGLKGGINIFDILNPTQKAPPIRQFIDVTLEDLYNGNSKIINYNKMIICNDCNGKGGQHVTECAQCNGNGIQIMTERIGFMTMKRQRECPYCNGKGTSIPENCKCKKCNGKGLNKVEKRYDFIVPRGSTHGDKIVLKGQGHEICDAVNGDLIIILRYVKHNVFERMGADLMMTKKITLKQSLCGYDILITHLNRYTIRLKSIKGEIVQPGQLKVVYSKGMPQKGNSNLYGNLYVKFEIEFPSELNEEIRNKIGHLLPMDVDDICMDKDEEFVVYETAEIVYGEAKVTPACGRSAYDEDED